jgi:hypothetical protein
MNTKSIRISIITSVLALSLVGGVNSRAQSPAPAAPSPAAITQLTQAYAALSVADHDYQGHRAKAMKQIEVAMKEMGITLGGNGKGHEVQVTSDQQLQTATALLQQARPGLPPKAQKHVDKALEDLAAALAIK